MSEYLMTPLEDSAESKSKRRWILGTFLLCAFLMVMIGIFSVTNLLFGPAIAKRVEAMKNLQSINFDFNTLLSQSDQQRAEIIALKQKDTDHDGISDYDELYVYGTSPYLADTDSDGVSDLDEIRRGTNPNCDESKQFCFQPNTNQTNSAPTNPSLDQTKQVLQQFSNIVSNPQTQLALKEAMNVEDMRQILYQAGFDATKVAALSADQITSIRDSLLAASGNNSDNTALDTVVQNKLKEKDISQWTVQDMRDVLIQGGLSADAVNLMTDEEITSITQQTLQEILQQQSNQTVAQGKAPEPTSSK